MHFACKSFPEFVFSHTHFQQHHTFIIVSNNHFALSVLVPMGGSFEKENKMWCVCARARVCVGMCVWRGWLVVTRQTIVYDDDNS
jgi:hypothetical protein